jgi:hypothetical protein
MKKVFVSLFLLFLTNPILANTQRTPQFSNEKVNVWETIIYPGNEQKLAYHRHETDRVLVALDTGVLKVINDKGQSHLLELTQNKSYFLPKNVPGEMHTDINTTDHPIRVIVIELKN